MEPAMAQFESKYKKTLNLVSINVDDKGTPEQKKYSKIGPDAIPFTVWLDSKGKPIDQQVGLMTFDQLVERTEAAIKKAR